MDRYDFQARIDAAKRRAHGGWPGILERLGVDRKLLNKKNQPCPGCAGEDRFQFTDKYGEGNYVCRGCGAGGGFKLAEMALGWSFIEVLQAVETIVGSATLPRARNSEPSPERLRKLAQRIWDQASAITQGDEVDRYLRARGLQLPVYPQALRFHPALGYYEKDQAGKSKKVAEYPAMLACIQGADGHAITLHRTYLREGAKALGRESKKVLSSGINGAAVRLFEPAGELAIAEGIETALAVHSSTGKPVWAALSAGNLEKLWIPDSVRRVWLYADNDADAQYDGQASAFNLARRLKKQDSRHAKGEDVAPRAVEVFVPKTPGADWADVWLMRFERKNKAA